MESTNLNSATEGLSWRTIITLAGVALAIFMGALENTVAGTAMPTVIASLGGIELYSWVFAAYILAATIMTPIWGKMADLIGRRPALFGGLACFIIGSALSGAARSMPQLIAFRALQGLGAGALFPIGMTIAADLLTLERRTKVIGLFSGMWGVASLVGPLVGGYLTEKISWRWVFYINLPFGLIAAVLVWATYTERHGRRSQISLDYAGAATLSASLTLLLLIVQQGAGLAQWMVIVGGGLCLLLLAVFVAIEHRSREPLMPPDLFHNRLVLVATLHGLFAGMALIGTMSFTPLFVQAVIGTSATEAGSILTPFVLAWVVCAPLGGRLLLHFGYRPIIIAGAVSMLISAVLLAQLSSETGRAQLILDVIFMGIGGGLSTATQTIAVQHAVPSTRMGVATSAVIFSRSIGAALGTGAMGALMTWRLGRQLASGRPGLDGLAAGHDISAIVRHSTRAAVSPEATQFFQRALASSLRSAFVFVLAATVAATVISFFVPGGQAKDLGHPEHH